MSTTEVSAFPVNEVDAQEVVVELYRSYAPMSEAQLWPREEARWHELIFALLAAHGDPEILTDTLRSLVDSLEEWGLLDVGELAALADLENSERMDAANAVTIRTLLLRSGFSAEGADQALRSLSSAASGLRAHFESKPQLFFRYYGTLMLDELQKYFDFADVDPATVRRAFAIWFQNALDMPVPIDDQVTRAACRKLGVSHEALIEAADQADLNVALLDEALRAFWVEEVEGRKTESAEEGGERDDVI